MYPLLYWEMKTQWIRKSLPLASLGLASCVQLYPHSLSALLLWCRTQSSLFPAPSPSLVIWILPSGASRTFFSHLSFTHTYLSSTNLRTFCPNSSLISSQDHLEAPSCQAQWSHVCIYLHMSPRSSILASPMIMYVYIYTCVCVLLSHLNP